MTDPAAEQHRATVRAIKAAGVVSSRSAAVATAITDALLAGPWTRHAMTDRVHREIALARRWLTELVEAIRSDHPHPPARPILYRAVAAGPPVPGWLIGKPQHPQLTTQPTTRPITRPIDPPELAGPAVAHGRRPRGTSRTDRGGSCNGSLTRSAAAGASPTSGCGTTGTAGSSGHPVPRG